MIKNIKCSFKELWGEGDGINIDFNKLNLFVGKNGTGKTIILKLAWIGTHLTITRKYLLTANITDLQHRGLVEYVFKKTFEDPNFNGELIITFDDNVTTKIILEQGICTKFTCEGLNNNSKIQKILFMSKEMRLFSEMNKYLKTRKRLVGVTQELEPQSVELMFEDYPMYDVMIQEELLSKLPFDFPEPLRKTLKEDYDFPQEPKSLFVDLDECKYFLEYMNGDRINVLTLGAGHQSILNMFVMTEISK